MTIPTPHQATRIPEVARPTAGGATDTAPTPARGLRRLVPRSLFARVTLIMVVGLAIAQLLTFAAIRYERGAAMRVLMMSGIEQDIASSIAILDRLPAEERPAWLGRLERRNFRFTVGGDVSGPSPASPSSQEFATALANALRPFEVVHVARAGDAQDSLRMQVKLTDGSSVTVDARRVPMPVSDWVMWVLWIQLVVLGACGWFAVRLGHPAPRPAGLGSR